MPERRGFPVTDHAHARAATSEAEKAHLEIIDPPADNVRVPLTFNPAQYQVKKPQVFQEIAIPGLPTPPLQWVRGGLGTLSLEAWWIRPTTCGTSTTRT